MPPEVINKLTLERASNKCCMSNVKNAVSKQNCNIYLNYIKSMRDRITTIYEKCYTHIFANYRIQKELINESCTERIGAQNWNENF